MTERQIEAKRQEEMQVAGELIRLFCRKRHMAVGSADGLCPACHAVYAYAMERLRRCPRMAEKTFCSECPIHCYRPAEREQIRQIMRYAGPRMLWHHPWMTLRHMYFSWQSMRRAKKKAAVAAEK